LLAAGLVACFPNLIFHTGVLLTETVFIFLLVAAVAVAFVRDGSESKIGRRRLLLAGALIGCATLVRPIVLVLLPAVPVATVVTRCGWRRTAAVSAWVWIGCAAVVAPWSARNWIVMDAPVLVSTNLGDNLCIGHQPGAPGFFVLPTACRDLVPAGKLTGPALEIRRNAASRDQAIRFAVNDPRAEWKLLLDKAYYTFREDHDGVEAAESYGEDRFLNESLRSWLERFADWYFFGILAIGAVGWLLLWRPPWETRSIFFALAMVGIAAGPLIFFGHPRFHVPLSPLLATAGAVGLARWMGSGVEARASREA